MSTQLIPGANTALPEARICIRIRSQGEIDAVAYRLSTSGKVRSDGDMVFYGQNASDDGLVRFGGHERDSSFDIDLAQQPADIERLAVCYSQISAPGQVELTLQQQDHVLLTCLLDTAGRSEQAMILAECYRRQGQWKLRFVAQGFDGGLKPLSEHFGVEIANDDAAPCLPDTVSDSSSAAPLQIDRNGSQLATAAQHQPLDNWFRARQIEPQFDYQAVNLAGYFDEAAAAIGTHYALLQPLLQRISHAYRRTHLHLNLDLKKYSQQDAGRIQRICRDFYQHTLFSRCHYHKQDKVLHLKLQTAEPIRQFFCGIWLEWWALNTLLDATPALDGFACARQIKVKFSNQDVHELDAMLLPAGQLPLIIECKTGEFRHQLDKYLQLCKRLQLPGERFILLAGELDPAQVHTLSAMYPLSFASPSTLASVLAALLQTRSTSTG